MQTLFADGFIAYGVLDQASWDHRSPALELLAQDEQIVPDSADAMTWTCSDWGMEMGLSRDVPERIRRGSKLPASTPPPTVLPSPPVTTRHA